MSDRTVNESVQVQQWIEERRGILSRADLSRGNYTVAAMTALGGLPRALNALESVLEVLDAGVRDGDSAELIRRVALIEIEGAINE